MVRPESPDSESSADVCPNGCNLQGAPIPETSQWMYGGSTHFSRKLGHYDMERDCTVSWSCPDCGITWPR